MFLQSLSDNLSVIFLKIIEFIAQFIPMAIMWTTMACAFALLYAVGEYLFHRRVRNFAVRYRPGMIGIVLTVIGAAAIAICVAKLGFNLDPAATASDARLARYSLMAAGIVFDIGAILLLWSETRDEPSQI